MFSLCVYYVYFCLFVAGQLQHILSIKQVFVDKGNHHVNNQGFQELSLFLEMFLECLTNVFICLFNRHFLTVADFNRFYEVDLSWLFTFFYNSSWFSSSFSASSGIPLIELNFSGRISTVVEFWISDQMKLWTLFFNGRLSKSVVCQWQQRKWTKPLSLCWPRFHILSNWSQRQRNVSIAGKDFFLIASCKL